MIQNYRLISLQFIVLLLVFLVNGCKKKPRTTHSPTQIVTLDSIVQTERFSEDGIKPTPEQIANEDEITNLLYGASSVKDRILNVSYRVVQFSKSSINLMTPMELKRLNPFINNIFNDVNINLIECNKPRLEISNLYLFEDKNSITFNSFVKETSSEHLTIFLVDGLLSKDANGDSIHPTGFGELPNKNILKNKNFIVIKYDQLFTPTLIHELGHFFGLYHTHETAFGDETALAVSCRLQGDRICDTDPSPDLNGKVSLNCNYIGDQKYLKNGAIDMSNLISNFMSYGTSLKHDCRTMFTGDQKNKMYIVASKRRSNLINNCDEVPIDYDGNIYQTVTIGKQKWLSENLKTTHFLNGDLIPKNGILEHDNLSYGRMYSWETITDPRGVCPKGWSVTSSKDYDRLLNSNEVNLNTGTLKSTSNLWLAPNIGATNSTGLSLLPAGEYFGSFDKVGIRASMLTTDTVGTNGIRLYFFTNSSIAHSWVNTHSNPRRKEDKFSCRCVEDI